MATEGSERSATDGWRPWRVAPDSGFEVRDGDGSVGLVQIDAKRFLVERKAFDAYVQSYAEAAGALVVGDPMDAATKLGPMARADLVDTTDRQVRDAVAAGGHLVSGGKRRVGPGNFYEPTVIVGADPQSPIPRPL